MSLTIDEAIARFEQNAEQNERWVNAGLNPEANAEYAAEHRQLAAWLRELQERRKADSCEGCVNQSGKSNLLVCYTCRRHYHYADLYKERRTDGQRTGD